MSGVPEGALQISEALAGFEDADGPAMTEVGRVSPAHVGFLDRDNSSAENSKAGETEFFHCSCWVIGCYTQLTEMERSLQK